MSLRIPFIAIISELLLWGLTGLLIWGLFLGSKSVLFKGQSRHPQTIVLAFKDASQLTVGSPVHFMGTDVGYVTRVKPHGQRVEVEMKTYDDTVAIPSGATFTVEFNGLAGAKTLEILPPGDGYHDKAEDHFIVYEPIRMRDVMKTQMVLAQALESSSENLEQSLGYVKDQKALMDVLARANQRITEGRRTLKYALEVMHYENSRVHLSLANATSTIQSIDAVMTKVRHFTHPASFKPGTLATLRYVYFATGDIYQALSRTYSESRVQTIDDRIQRTGLLFNRWHTQLQAKTPGLFYRWTKVNTGLQQFDNALCKVEQSLAATPLASKIEQWRQSMQVWAVKTRNLLNKAVEQEINTKP